MGYPVLIPASGGALLGLFFFGGLLLTVSKGLASSRPWLWFLPSLLVRLTVVFAGFLFMAGADTTRLIWCAVGFLAIRIVMSRQVGNHHRLLAGRSGETCI